MFNLWLSDSGPEKFYPVSKSVLKIVDFFAYHKRLYLLHIDLYCDLIKKFKDYKLLLLLQRQMMVPPVFFKLVSIFSVSMSPVSNGSYRNTDTPFYNFKAKHLPSLSK